MNSSIESKHAAIDQAMIEEANCQKANIGKYIKAIRVNLNTWATTLVEGICVNVFFNRREDVIIYTVETKEGKRVNLYSWDVKSIN